jgi:hypothetical protein
MEKLLTKFTEGWRSGSRGRALAKQVRGPEFKPQYHKK